MPDETYDAAKYAHELKLRHAERAHDRNREMGDLFNANADRNSQAAIRILLAINGGAAVALLAFIGGLASRANWDLRNLSSVTDQLHWFILGIIASGIAAAAAYVTNYCYAGALLMREETWEHPYTVEHRPSKLYRWLGRVTHLIGFSSAIVGLFFFICGMYGVESAIHGLK